MQLSLRFLFGLVWIWVPLLPIRPNCTHSRIINKR
jgi:hypothetical protein